MTYDSLLTKAIIKQEEKFREEQEWKKYISKGGQTNISHLKEIHELMSRFRAIKIENKMEIEPLMTIINEVQVVCHELSVQELKYKISKNRADQDLCRKQIRDFQQLTLEKIQEISYHMSLQADSFKVEQDPNAQKDEMVKKPTNVKNDIVCFSKPDLKLGYLVSFADKTNPRPTAELSEIGVRAGIPMALRTTDYIMRVLWTSFDYLHTEGYLKDMPLGGIFSVNIYDMPSGPINHKGWRFKTIAEMESALADNSLIRSETSPTQKGTSNQIKVSYKLPPNFYQGNNMKKQVAIWLKERKQWVTDSDLIDRENINIYPDGLIEVQTFRLAPLCYMQSRCLDYPYKSWKLRSVSENDKAHLDIEGKRLTFKFEIGSGFIKLRKMADKEFLHLYDKEFEPAQLLYELYRCGVNLLPVDEDAEQCGIQVKVPDAEDRAINEVSLGCRAFYFKNSRWATQLPKEMVPAKFIQNIEYDDNINEDFEDDWKTVAWWKNKCTILKVKDKDLTWNTDREENVLTHSLFYVLLKNTPYGSEKALDKFREYRDYKDDYYHNVLFISTIRKFLKLLRVFSFTKAAN